MKIKERFIKCKNKYDEYYILPVIDDAEQLVKIADDFAIGFAEYLFNNYINDERHALENPKELLEIYKKSL
jgi:hypothetical protein